MNDTQYVRGAEKLARRIRTIRERLLLPAMKEEIGALLLRRTMDRFDRQVSPDGEPWAPLKPYTIRRKATLGYGSKPSLVRTGQMRSAIQIIRGMAAGGYATSTGAGLRIGIVDAKIAKRAREHHTGTARMVPRRFLGVGKLDVKAVDSLLRRRAQTIMRE